MQKVAYLQKEEGVLGELSKVREEFEELQDADARGCKIMVGEELADMYRAIKHYAETWGFSMYDLEVMSDITDKSCANGC